MSSLGSNFGIENHGIINSINVNWNFGTEELYEDTISKGLGTITKGGALAVETGKCTGRSPNDKFIVKEASSEDNIWWGDVNKSTTAEVFNAMQAKICAYFQNKELYVQDLYAGADKTYRLNVRIISESPWHSLFSRNMFIEPELKALAEFIPDFTVLHAPYFHADANIDGTNSEVFILVDFLQKMVLIGGSIYAGEIKKSIFSILNYMLPEKNVMPMHCSANIGADGDTAIFFGLSGTGKTTLSADGSRALIGDDEHGWSDNGVFNFEGGCYAKVINLDKEMEPEIYATTERYGTIMENVVFDEKTRKIDFNDSTLAENTRASYPINFINNIAENGQGGQPKNIIMLTADAFGVLPPISQLSPEQAMYHFMSGYTARVAGTERGVTEPQAVFSTCFGAPFMPRHPSVYAKLLGAKMAKTGAKCWLVNTGWSGGAYGTGKRMSIHHTRAMVNAALDGSLANAEFVIDPFFNMHVPLTCANVPDKVLQPKLTWQDGNAYDLAAANLCKLFEENFKQFEEYVSNDVKAAGIFSKK